MRKVLLVLLIVAVPAVAADQKRTIVRAGHLLDVTNGTISDDVGIMITGKMIDAVLPFAQAKTAAPDAVVIDLLRYTVLPGFTDCHNHLLGDPNNFNPAAYLMTSSGQGVVWGVKNLRTYLDKGFTAVRDACEADTAYGQFALREGVQRGLIPGPRIFAAGSCVSITGGHGDANVLAPDQPLPVRPNLADNVDETATVVRRDLKYGADWIKLMATGGILDPWSDYNNQELSEEQMAKAVEIAHRAGRKVMAHAEGTVGIKAAVRAGVDSIEHGTVLDEEAATMMEQRGTWLVPTLYTFQYGVELGEKLGVPAVSLNKVRKIISYQGPSFQRALAHHLKIAFGLDIDPEMLPREFQALVRGGMTPLQAIQTATTNAAALLGTSDTMGSIAKGKVADIIAVESDPLKNIKVLENVVFVMREGAIVKDGRQ